MRFFVALLLALFAGFSAQAQNSDDADLKTYAECIIVYGILTQIEEETGKGPRYRAFTDEATWWNEMTLDYAKRKHGWSDTSFDNYIDATGIEIGSLTEQEAHGRRAECIVRKTEAIAAFENRDLTDDEKAQGASSASGGCPENSLRIVAQCVSKKEKKTACNDLPGAKVDPNCRS